MSRSPGDNPENLPPRGVAQYWDRWAPVWNPLLRAAGLDRKFRREGVSVLQLEKGSVVLDIACGTGFNFPFLEGAVGEGGRIIAIDISPAMLRQAKVRAEKKGWANIDFVLGDVAEMRLPPADAAAAFWCMVSIHHYQDAIKNIVSSLRQGGRLALLDFKLVEGIAGQLVNPFSKLLFKATHQDIRRRPWQRLPGQLQDVGMREWKLGGLLLTDVYLAWGAKH